MRSVLLLVVLAGCPKSGGGGTTVTPPSPGVGCPAARDVYMASYLTPEEGQAGRSGWVLPLFNTTANIEGEAGYVTMPREAAATAGVPAAPASLWLLLPKAPPCKATIGAYYGATLDGETPQYTYGVELDGCPAPPNPEDGAAIAIASLESPSQCQAVAPTPIAERLGTDGQAGWQRPTKETPLPPAVAAALPANSCVAPACETLWSVAAVEIGPTTVAWAGAVNWLTTTGDDPCAWPVSTESGIYLPGADGTAVKLTEGQDHPLGIVAALVDGGTAKVLVAAGPGEYTTYDLAGTTATVGRHLVWLLPGPESFDAVDHLGPYCGSE